MTQQHEKVHNCCHLITISLYFKILQKKKEKSTIAESEIWDTFELNTLSLYLKVLSLSGDLFKGDVMSIVSWICIFKKAVLLCLRFYSTKLIDTLLPAAFGQ